MRNKKALFPILVCVLLSLSCRYIVLPEGIEVEEASAENKGWTAVATSVSKSETGDLHIDLTIRNETGDWSAMKAVDGQPALLTAGGKTTNCDTVYVGTGGHRLAPGFQMRGYMTGKKAEPKTQMLYVECQGVEAAPGSELSVDYVSYTGELDYYHQENGEAFEKLEINLDELATDLTYPIYQPVEGLIQTPEVEITAISDNVITLEDVQRIEQGLQFTWQNYNPTEFALTTHIGDPPVIGEAGIIYGIFEIMDIVSVPLTPAGEKMQWTTDQAAPADEKGFYILLSVESKQMRLYVSYAIDITGE